MNHIEGHQNNNRPRVFRMKKIIPSLLFILTIFSANQILAQDQDQDQGTDMAPWAKSILQPLMGKPLQASFELINDQGFSLTYIDKYGLIFSWDASRPSDEQRGNWLEMATKSSFTISLWTCGPPDGSPETVMWEEKIRIAELRSNKNESQQIVESIRELTLLTSQITKVDGIAKSWQQPNGDKGTGIAWEGSKSEPSYRLNTWRKEDTGDTWITYRIGYSCS